MAKKRTISGYEEEIKNMIIDRLGKFDAWLTPQVEATAMNRMMLDKLQKELSAEKSLMLPTVGVGGQQKLDANPLLSHYKELHRTLLLQYEAIGLSYKTTPSKIKEPVKQGGEEHDKLKNLLDDIHSV